MYIKFIKRHSIGIKEGIVAKVNPSFGERMLKEEYAEASTEEDFNEFKKVHYGGEEKVEKKKKSVKKKKKQQ